MAELAFKVKAEYDEVVFLREELARLRGEMLKVDTATEEGQRLMARLEEQYASTSKELGNLVENAAKAAYEMKDGMLGADDAAVGLMNTLKSGEATITDVFSSLNGQISGVTTALEDAKNISSSLIDEMTAKLSDLNREKNLADAQGNTEMAESIQADIVALEGKIESLKNYQSMMDETTKSTETQIQAVKDAIAAYEDLADKQANVVDLTEESANAMKSELEEALQNVLDKMSAFQDTSSGVSDALEMIKTAAAGYRGKSVELSTATEVLTKSQGMLSKSTIELAKNLARIVLPANAARVAISLLTGGLGAAAIAGATILIKKLIDRYKEQKKEAEEAAEAQREMSDTIAKSAAKPIAAFEEMRRKWITLDDEMSKRDFIEENKKALDSLGLSIDGVDQAEALFISHTQDYWEAQITRARADLYRQQVQGKIARKVELEDYLENNKDAKNNAKYYDNVLGRWIWYNKENKAARDEIEQIEKDLPALEQKADSAVESVQEFNDKISGIGKDANYQDGAKRLREEWVSAKESYEAIMKDATATKGQVAEAKAKVDKAATAYKNWTGESPEPKKTGGRGGSKKADDSERKERENAYKRYGEQIKAMIRSMEDDIAREQISAIENNEEAISKQLDLEKKMLVDKAAEIGEAMTRLFDGNVDLLNRKTIDAAKLTEKGWEDAGEGIATVFSSQYGITDSRGKEHEILVTPILPDGSVLSEQELEDYIKNVLSGADNILEADEKGLVIAVDVDADSGEKLHEMQELYYELLALIEEFDQLKRTNRQKGLDKQNEANRREFLTQYGSWEEQRSAIREKYQKEREKDETEWGRKLIDMREQAELAAVDIREKTLKLMEAERGGDYNEQKTAITEYYDLQIRAAEALNDRTRATELLSEKEAKLFELESKFDYESLFGDFSKYTRAELKAAKELGNNLLKNGKLELEQSKYVKEALNGIEEAERNKIFDIPSGSLNEYIRNLRILKDLRRQKKDMEDSGNFAQKDIEELEKQIKRWEELTKDEKGMVITNGVATGLEKAAGFMRDIANATQDVNLEGMADIAEGIATSFNIIKSAASQDWASAIVNVVSVLLSAGVEEEALTKQLEVRVKALADAFKMLSLSFDADKFYSIFGDVSTLSAVKEYSKLTQESAKALAEAVKALDEADYNPGNTWDDRKTRWQVRSNFAEQWSEYQYAIERGQRGLQTMLVKTKNRAGILNYFGWNDEYKTLYDLAPEIFNKDGSLNIEKTDVFLKSDMSQYLDETQRQALENATELNKKYEENLKGLKDSLSSLFGSINDTLADATMDGIKRGSALGVDYMKDQMTGIVESLGHDLLVGIYSTYTADYQEKMLKMIQSGNASSEDFLNLLDEMMNELGPTYDAASEGIRTFYEKAREKGYDVNRVENADATSRSFQQISETTGSAIQGGVTALRLSSEVRNQHLSIMNEHLTEMLQQQMLSTTLAEDIRNIEKDAFMAIIEIRNNTAGNLATVRNIADMVDRIEKKTREM